MIRPFPWGERYAASGERREPLAMLRAEARARQRLAAKRETYSPRT